MKILELIVLIHAHGKERLNDSGEREEQGLVGEWAETHKEVETHAKKDGKRETSRKRERFGETES